MKLGAGVYYAFALLLLVGVQTFELRAQTYLPRAIPDVTSYTKGLLTNSTAASARGYLGIVGGTNSGNTFNETQFTEDADTNVVVKSGATLTNVVLVTAAGSGTSILVSNTTTRVSLEETLGTFRTFKMFGGVNDGATVLDDKLTEIQTYMEDGDTLVFVGEGEDCTGCEFVFNSVEITKDINFVGINAPKILHQANATGHMWKWTVPSSQEVTGFDFDGNMANQPTNNYYALLYTYGAPGKGQKIHRNNFRNFKWGGLDFQTQGKSVVVENGFFNGYKVLEGDTNTTSYAFAWQFAPGIQDNRPEFLFARNDLTNTPTEAGKRNSGGVMLFGAESVNHFNYGGVEKNRFAHVGGDTAYSGYHVGVAAIDWYRHSQGWIQGNIGTNCGYYFIKVQQSADVVVKDNHGHGLGSGVYNYSPMEREQVSEMHRAVFRDNWSYIGANDTIGFYLSAGTGGGWYETIIDGFYAPNAKRGMQIEGINDTDGSNDGYGPLTLKNIHINAADGGYALRFFGTQARISLEDSVLEAAGSSSALIMIQTNTGTKLMTKNATFRSTGSGWGARVWGVAEWYSDFCLFEETGTGEALEIQDDANGANVGKLFFNRNNTITGDYDVVTDDIDGGYAWLTPTVQTHYPLGWTKTMGDGSASYLEDMQRNAEGAVLFQRMVNTNTAGSAIAGLRVGPEVVGTFSVFGTNYSDGDRRGWLVYRSENSSGVMGVRVEAPNSGQKVVLRGGTSSDAFTVLEGTNTSTMGTQRANSGVITNTLSAGIVNVVTEAYGAGWNGSTNVPTKDAVYDILNTLAPSFVMREVDSSPSLAPSQIVMPNGTLTDLGGGSIQYTPSASGVTVREEDGTPSVAATTIRFPNTTVTDNGGGDVSVSIAASLTGTTGFIDLPLRDAFLPASGGATLDTTTGPAAKLLFDDAADEEAVWSFILPPDVATITQVRVLRRSTDTDNTRTARFEASFMAAESQTENADWATDSYGAANVGSFAGDTTSGDSGVGVITATDVDGASSTKLIVRMKLKRDATDGTDTLVGDFEVYSVRVQYTR